MQFHGLAGAMLVCACLSTASSAAPGPFVPLKNGVVDYGDTQCTAYRTYGNPEKPLTLAIRPSPNGQTYEMLLARPSGATDSVEELKGSVDFGHGPIKAWLLHYRAKTKNLDIRQFRISANEMAQARAAAAVTFNIEGEPGAAFQLSAMPQLLAGLEACSADLKKYWNMDGEKDGRIAKSAKGDVRGVFSSPDDYPSEALFRGPEGDAQFFLLVDEKGKVAGCHVLVPSGVPVLDAMGCVVIQTRAKFTPALESPSAVSSSLRRSAGERAKRPLPAGAPRPSTREG